MKACVGIDYELNDFVVMELRGGKPEIVFQERMAFMDTVKRVADRFKMPRNLLPVTALPGRETMLKALRLPEKLREKDIPGTVQWQFKDIEEDIYLKHCVTGKTVFGGWLVIAAAVSQKQISALANKVYRFGLNEKPVIDMRVLALWRGARYFHPGNTDTAMVVLEEIPNLGARIVAGKECLEFAREITGDNIEFEIRRTITHYKQEFTDKADVLVVGEDIPGNTAAVGMSLYPFAKPGVDFSPGSKRKVILSKTPVLPSRKSLLTVAGAALIWLGLVTSPWAAGNWWSARTTAIESEMIGLRPALAQADTIMKQTQTVQQWNAVLESFSPLPTVFELDDLRYAIPSDCWLTALETVGQQTQSVQNQQGQNQNEQGVPNQQGQPTLDLQSQSAQPRPTGQSNEQHNAVALPPAPAGFKIEGYSNEVNTIAAFRDNLSKLPWTANPKIVSVTTDNTLGAYKFALSVGVKGGPVLSADTVRSNTDKPDN
ncbi:Fimbrial assembly protein (PilN) [Pelotomaculum schinkii]|uniref:Fimbrial assembly protein (PilN) n=1 Tax=Pelotomaculum schinkii TaxID=78350 RepID=A0A4Y7R702_9FIRM|nr:PilN domain-containing protein [Pelotomaculum schinkii]TEB04728.1 Fimbrial assembly protein (PilN) [Pelotomaculum schinkii]